MQTVKIIISAISAYAVMSFLVYIMIRSMQVFPLTFAERFYY